MRRWLVLLVAVLAACAGEPTAAPSRAPTSDAAASGAPGVPAALNWTAPLVGGGQLNGGDLAGRDVVLWFWAPW